MLYDFHTHTFLSDGILSPIELIRRAQVKGYRGIALTDHVAIGTMARVIEEITQDCALARTYWNILAIPGVELTHVPAQAINDIACQAKQLGAWLVIVHGETTNEPVERGTNLAAVRSPYVDILAHPGFLTVEEAQLAREGGTFIEITTREGHRLTNKHIATVAQKTGANLIINSDAHNSSDLLSLESITNIIETAELDEELSRQILNTNPLLLINRLPIKV